MGWFGGNDKDSSDKGDKSGSNDRVGGGYTQKDAQKDTGSSRRDTSKAHHDARNSAAKSGGWNVPKDRHRK